eukprot:TRINITY_DN2078_c1_g2_i3.p1 TRINITY_DN2078_c1_g2~~TRINITY_DN2078_c1_g2_i3.p1  ORF type:complete len:1171 (-),score=256.37 TRINITY_DN2078_c1_g2_i3:107-3253(-)
MTKHLIMLSTDKNFEKYWADILSTLSMFALHDSGPQILISHDIVVVVKLMLEENVPKITKEALRVINNLSISASQKLRTELYQQGVIESLLPYTQNEAVQNYACLSISRIAMEPTDELLSELDKWIGGKNGKLQILSLYAYRSIAVNFGNELMSKRPELHMKVNSIKNALKSLSQARIKQVEGGTNNKEAKSFQSYEEMFKLYELNEQLLGEYLNEAIMLYDIISPASPVLKSQVSLSVLPYFPSSKFFSSSFITFSSGSVPPARPPPPAPATPSTSPTTPSSNPDNMELSSNSNMKEQSIPNNTTSSTTTTTNDSSSNDKVIYSNNKDASPEMPTLFSRGGGGGSSKTTSSLSKSDSSSSNVSFVESGNHMKGSKKYNTIDFRRKSTSILSLSFNSSSAPPSSINIPSATTSSNNSSNNSSEGDILNAIDFTKFQKKRRVVSMQFSSVNFDEVVKTSSTPSKPLKTGSSNQDNEQQNSDPKQSWTKTRTKSSSKLLKNSKKRLSSDEKNIMNHNNNHVSTSEDEDSSSSSTNVIVSEKSSTDESAKDNAKLSQRRKRSLSMKFLVHGSLTTEESKKAVVNDGDKKSKRLSMSGSSVSPPLEAKIEANTPSTTPTSTSVVDPKDWKKNKRKSVNSLFREKEDKTTNTSTNPIKKSWRASMRMSLTTKSDTQPIQSIQLVDIGAPRIKTKEPNTTSQLTTLMNEADMELVYSLLINIKRTNIDEDALELSINSLIDINSDEYIFTETTLVPSFLNVLNENISVRRSSLILKYLSSISYNNAKVQNYLSTLNTINVLSSYFQSDQITEEDLSDPVVKFIESFCIGNKENKLIINGNKSISTYLVYLLDQTLDELKDAKGSTTTNLTSLSNIIVDCKKNQQLFIDKLKKIVDCVRDENISRPNTQLYRFISSLCKDNAKIQSELRNMKLAQILVNKLRQVIFSNDVFSSVISSLQSLLQSASKKEVDSGMNMSSNDIKDFLMFLKSILKSKSSNKTTLQSICEFLYNILCISDKWVNLFNELNLSNELVSFLVESGPLSIIAKSCLESAKK